MEEFRVLTHASSLCEDVVLVRESRTELKVSGSLTGTFPTPIAPG